ncbi:hypothetical protein [Sphingobium algorifonticola]|uniref:hypothetical protein n=1 Tax=Sphingobium algorifonticola TaxID=2008318 RepID=UPI0013E29FBE|nr:hypothetical protein [Sphingobium algorifonticola]
MQKYRNIRALIAGTHFALRTFERAEGTLRCTGSAIISGWRNMYFAARALRRRGQQYSPT